MKGCTVMQNALRIAKALIYQLAKMETKKNGCDFGECVPMPMGNFEVVNTHDDQ